MRVAAHEVEGAIVDRLQLLAEDPELLDKLTTETNRKLQQGRPSGLLGAGALVFLSCIKELPLTFLLSPLNFQTLALRVYSYTSEAMFAEAAPHAVAIVVLSAVLIGVLFKKSVEFS